LQQQQFGPRTHVEERGDLEEQRQQLRHRDFVGRPVVDRLADGADRLGEILDRVMRGHIARLEMHFGDADTSSGDEAVEDFGEKAPLLRLSRPMMPNRRRRDGRLGIDEEIPRVHVGVKEAVAERLAQKGLNEHAPEPYKSKPACLEFRLIVERNASTHSVVSTRRAVRSQLTAWGRGSRDRPWCSPRVPKKRRPQAADPFPSPPNARSVSTVATSLSRRPSAENRSPLPRHIEEGLEIALELPVDVRPQDFDRDFLRALRRTSISARCTCAIEAAATAGPNVVKSSATVGRVRPDDRLRFRLREGRHAVLQRLEILRDLQTRPRRGAWRETGRASRKAGPGG
jgi:hypothetical protein